MGRVTLVVLVTTGGVFYYITQKDRHPGDQLPHDPSKKVSLKVTTDLQPYPTFPLELGHPWFRMGSNISPQNARH